MQITITDLYKQVTPDEGFSLVNGDTVSKLIYTPLTDDLSAWSEVPDSSLPPVGGDDEEVSEEEMLNYLKSLQL